MDSSDEDIFTTAPSQVYFPDLRYEMQIEEGLQTVHTALNLVSRLNDGLAILGAKPFAAQLAGPSSSATQVEPRIFAMEIQPHLAAAEEEISKAEKVLESKWALKAQKIAQHVSEAEIEELVTTLTEVSLAKPDTRLVMAYPCDNGEYPDGDSLFLSERTLNRKILMGVIQGREHVDFTFKLPYHKHEIKIVYKPMSDDCSLILEKAAGTDIIFITNLDTMKNRPEYSVGPTIWEVLMPSQAREIQPGVWRILVSSVGKEYPNMIDILVLKRAFTVFIQDTNDIISTKRQAADPIGRTRSAKRRRLKITKKNSEVASMLDVDNNMSQMSHSTATLQKGHALIIKSQAKGEETYSLQIKHQLGKTPAAHVLSCMQSKMPRGMIAVKILLQNPQNIMTAAISWKREKMALEKINHENIVKLKSFDGRMLLLGLESLPPSLQVILHDQKQLLQPHEILRILQDLSSALAYLSTKDIVHHDIKPGNIAYSPSRGAVLLDFGFALSSSSRTMGGSPWYIPPEYLVNKSRGFAGDIWALGITMLCILGKIPLPETTGESWFIHELSRRHSADRNKMYGWLRRIDRKKEELGQDAGNSPIGLAGVQLLVVQMLHVKARLRVKAAELHVKAAAIELE